ncbi:MAG: alpha/beta hydrolase [Propionibacteriaceae bacterium]|nr:alpha/beta hydrolase [Propionibacteriaceae bacterium]
MDFCFRELRAHYEDEGTGAPLLLLNGVYMNCRSWDRVVGELLDGHRVVRLDFFDQGRSERPAHDYPIDLQCDLVVALLDELGLRHTDILATSYGGVVALQVASRYPDRVGRLIVTNTAAHFPPSFHILTLALASTFDRLSWLQPHVFDSLSRITRSIDGVDERKRLRDITCPTLVVSTQWDNLTPPRLQKELVAGIPDVTYARIEGCGHVVVHERPHELAALAKRFLAGEPVAASPIHSPA